jgi:hypothetical protein
MQNPILMQVIHPFDNMVENKADFLMIETNIRGIYQFGQITNHVIQGHEQTPLLGEYIS